MKKEISKSDPDFPYKKQDLTIERTSTDFPILEHSSNARLFPEGIQDELDIKEFKPGE